MQTRDLFEILVREHADAVRAYLLASIRDPAAADDLVQETFLAAWRNLHRYDRELPFGPWVRGIAAKLLLNWRRKTGRSKVWFCDEQVLTALDSEFERFQKLGGDTFDERLDALRDCLTRLSDPQSSAIELHYEHGLQCTEIARRLELGVEAVKKHLQRGRAVLYRCVSARLEAGGAA